MARNRLMNHVLPKRALRRNQISNTVQYGSKEIQWCQHTKRTAVDVALEVTVQGIQNHNYKTKNQTIQKYSTSRTQMRVNPP